MADAILWASVSAIPDVLSRSRLLSPTVHDRNGATTVGNLPFSPLGMESWTHAKVLSASSSNDVVCAAAMHSFNFSEYGNMTGNNASHRSQRSQATDLGKAFTRYVT
jgi:hypothetical protein